MATGERRRGAAQRRSRREAARAVSKVHMTHMSLHTQPLVKYTYGERERCTLLSASRSGFTRLSALAVGLASASPSARRSRRPSAVILYTPHTLHTAPPVRPAPPPCPTRFHIARHTREPIEHAHSGYII